MDSEKEFVVWLEEQMAEKGLTQADLMRASGLSRGTISNILNQQRKVGRDAISGIAKGLGMPAETVFRIAGMLPPDEEMPPDVETVAHLMKLLDDRDRKTVVEFVRTLVNEKQRRDAIDELRVQLEGVPPGRVREALEIFDQWLTARGARRIR